MYNFILDFILSDVKLHIEEIWEGKNDSIFHFLNREENTLL